MIRTLIVDDEPLARRAVAALVGSHEDFAIVGEAGDGASAVSSIRALAPDLVFLDVQMPEMNGFEVIDAIGADAMPAIVFVTAFDAYAVQAFEVQAMDYVLKPFDDLRMGRVIERIREQRAAGVAQGDRLRAMLGEMRAQKLVARSRGAVRLIGLEEIDWIGAAGDYAEVHVGAQAMLVGESMASLEARLPKSDFARIHRSAIVRLDCIAQVRAGSHGDGIVRLESGAELRFSRRYREAIDIYLGR